MPILTQGQFTVSDLTDGTNGTSSYTHIRYSANANGNPMTTVATGAIYMGVAVSTSATAPTGYASYAWSLIKGDTGERGLQGLPTYTWIKYADDSVGNGMNDLPEGKRYLGLAYNKDVASESSTASDYTWSPLYDNVVVGGRNYLPNSTQFQIGSVSAGNVATITGEGLQVVSTSGNGNYVQFSPMGGYGSAEDNFLDGDDFTISFEMKSPDSVVIPTIYLKPAMGYYAMVGKLSTGFSTVSYSGKWKKANGLVFHMGFASVVGTTIIKNVKLEKSNVASAWTSAPEDKENLYTWIKYSTVLAGTSPSDNPTGCDYIGIAYNKDSAVESTNPADYTWSLYRGATGQQGLPSYVHIAYATSADGSVGFSTTVSAGKTYIGTYSDNTVADSASYSAYSWSLIKGADGSAGIDSISGVLSNDAHAVATDSAGNGGVYTGAVSTMKIFKGITDDSANWAVTVVVSGVTGSLSGKTYTATGLTADTGYVDFTATRSGYASVVKRFTISKTKQGATGGGGSAGLPAYLHIAYATSADGSVGFSTTSAVGKTYIGTYSDNTAADSGSYSAYAWSPLKGDKGTDGTTTYTWIRYADDQFGNGMADTATGKRWLGIATNQTTSVESGTASLYQWSPLFDNVKVGGRNLLLDTGTPITTTSYAMKNYTLAEPIPTNTQVTVSLKGTLGAGKTSFGLYNSGGSVSVASLSPADKGADGIFRKTFSWVVGASSNTFMTVYHMASGTVVNSTIEWIKLEIGNIDTDWTPAIEDDAVKIGNGTFIPDDIIKFNHIGVTNLAAISATLGNVSVGTLTGVTINASNMNLTNSGDFKAQNDVVGADTNFEIKDGLFSHAVGDSSSLFGFYDGDVDAVKGMYGNSSQGRIAFASGYFVKDVNGNMAFQPVVPSTLEAGGYWTDGGVETGYLHVKSTGDVSGSSSQLGILVGTPSAGNLKIDFNEVSAFSNGAISGLHLNPDGGSVTIGNNSGNPPIVFEDGYITNMNRVYASLVNGWVHYSATDDAYIRASYWKDKNGVVHFDGLIKNGTTASGTTLFTLPLGYRPVGSSIFVQHSDNTAKQVRIDVHEHGVVNLNEVSGTWVSLAGISFRAEN